MKPDKQRIAIAEACGWLQKTEYNSLAGWHKMTNTIVDEFFCKYTYDKDTKQRIGYVWKATSELPKYLTDLNAMHEAEVLNFRSISAVERYRAALHGVLVAKFAVESDITSCASHRAEAFLRTLNLWEESE